MRFGCLSGEFVGEHVCILVDLLVRKKILVFYAKLVSEMMDGVCNCID